MQLFKPCESQEALAGGDERGQDGNNTRISSDAYFTKQLNNKDNGGVEACLELRFIIFVL